MFDTIYNFVKTIPKGRVATYGQVAKALEIKDVRKIGWALHANKSSEVPCHRVVNKEGKLADNFAFNGKEEQQKRLEMEGIVFKKDGYVDLTKYCL
ncbi:MAG: MGMT family protein [bacterium]|nr:MAG: MGMT family protein [bacterium]